jgi:hypothetical protein
MRVSIASFYLWCIILNSFELSLCFIHTMSEVKSAMEYVFGNGIVCDCLDTARAVAYHPSVNKKVFIHTILAL